MSQRKARDGNAKLRERILVGGAEAFGRLGYADARVEDICVASGLSRPTFYKAFSSKDDVFDALSERHHESFRAGYRAFARVHGDPAQRLAKGIEAFLRWRIALGPIGRVLDTEARTPGRPTERHRARLLAELVRTAQRELRRAGRAPIDPLVMFAFVAAAEALADEMLARGATTELAIARRQGVLLRFFLGAVAQPGEDA